MSNPQREILIVDDDKDLRLLVRRILEGGGFAVSEADGVMNAMSLANARLPHLIITDLMMEPMSGFDFLKLLSESPKLSKTPVIVLSALQDKKSVFQALAVGASDYILKPLESKIVLQKIKKALRLASFAKFEFAAGDHPKLTVKVGVSVVAASETTLILDAPVRLASLDVVRLECAQLPQLAASSCILKSRGKVTKSEDPGRYLNEIAVIKGGPIDGS